MLNFNLGALADWQPFGVGEVLQFDLPGADFRRVEFDIMAEELVSVRATLGEEGDACVAVGQGFMSVAFTTDHAVQVTLYGPPEASVMIRTRAATQVIAPSKEPTFTKLEPRSRRMDDQFTRMMRIMEHNARRREAVLLEELSEVRKLSGKPKEASEEAPVIEDATE